MQVILTIDTETYPLSPGWMEDGLRRDLARDVYGKTSSGRSVGLTYQLQVLRRHRLQAVFMVESLFAASPQVGIGPLRQIVQEIRAGGHDVQLHPHPEWLPFIPALRVPLRTHLISDYTADEQAAIIKLAADMLMAAGAEKPIAFRAGDFAATPATLAALAMNGLAIDCSYNRAYVPRLCRVGDVKCLGRGTLIAGIWEFPVAGFEDFPRHFRPAQLAACSFQELRHSLEQAHALGWQTFVIVSHSFEMLKNRRSARREVSVRDSVVARFEKLCAYLDQHRGRFTTATFSGMDLGSLREDVDCPPLRGRLLNTGVRLYDQLRDRFGR